jgi:putative serine protease PepD
MKAENVKRLIASLIATAALAAACSTGTVGSGAAGSASPSPLPSATADFTQSDLSPPHSSTAEIVSQALPSVVNVRVRALSNGVFGTQEGQAEGSGVIIDKNGTILTNNHVVSGALKVEVVFNDDHDKMEASVIGTDVDRDLAVIKVDAHDLTPITLGRSGNLQLGDAVIALGFPLGLGGPTVTKGIVSGLDRTISVAKENGDREHLVGLLQTDAAINPGNSGGALVDSAGQLVGINTAAAQASSAENVGFAIAIDEALPVIKEILSKPAEDRAWLGVQVGNVDDESAAQQAGFPADARGALIVNVFSDSAAEAAGIEEGDLIVSIDDNTVASSNDLTEVLAKYKPGDDVDVKVLRDGGEQTLAVTLGRRPPTLDQ